jgi:hypothetical protein
MHVARLIIVYLLVLVLLAACSPHVQSETRHAWLSVRPAVIEFMDGLYAAIRSLVAGTESNHGIENQPPGTNYDIIITLSRGVVL